MKIQLKSAVYCSLLMIILSGSIFGAGVLSVYASRVSSTIFMSYLDKSILAPNDKNTTLHVHKQNVLDVFSGKNPKRYLVKQEFSGTSAFMFMIADKQGKIAKTVLIKKYGLSAFSHYLNDTTLFVKSKSFQFDPNPILNALQVRSKAQQQQIELDSASTRSKSE